LVQASDSFVYQLQQEIFLAPEVLVEGPMAEVCPISNLARGGAAKSALLEDFQASVQEALTALGPLAGASVGRGDYLA
jgi:hypothetical protein